MCMCYRNCFCLPEFTIYFLPLSCSWRFLYYFLSFWSGLFVLWNVSVFIFSRHTEWCNVVIVIIVATTIIIVINNVFSETMVMGYKRMLEWIPKTGFFCTISFKIIFHSLIDGQTFSMNCSMSPWTLGYIT